MTPEQLASLQRELAEARRLYFENPMRTALSLIWLRIAALGDEAGGGSVTGGGREAQT